MLGGCSLPSDACPYPEEPCVAYANGLAGFMSERATGTAFGSTCCVGGVGTSAASMDSSAGEEASNAPGITSVRISRGSIRPDECAVGGAALRVRPARCSLRELSDGNAPRKRNGAGASSYWHICNAMAWTGWPGEVVRRVWRLRATNQESEPGKWLHPAPIAGSVVWVWPSYTLVYPNVAGG